MSKNVVQLEGGIHWRKLSASGDKIQRVGLNGKFENCTFVAPPRCHFFSLT